MSPARRLWDAWREPLPAVQPTRAAGAAVRGAWRAMATVLLVAVHTAVSAANAAAPTDPAASAAPNAAADTAAVPDTRSMIEALTPRFTPRNLQVRPARPPADDAALVAPGQVPIAPVPPTASPGPQGLQNPQTGQTAQTAQTGQTAQVPQVPPPSDGLSLLVPFDVNSAQLRPESARVLGNLLAALLSPELKDSRFAIEGHTDASGAPAANLRLSQARADTVRLFLVALGVQPARLKAVGKGASEPLDRANPQAAENRRVRVVALP